MFNYTDLILEKKKATPHPLSNSNKTRKQQAAAAATKTKKSENPGSNSFSSWASSLKSSNASARPDGIKPPIPKLKSFKHSVNSSNPSSSNSSKPSLLNRLRDHLTNHKLAYSVGTGAAAAAGGVGLHAYLKHKKKHSFGNHLRTGAGLAAAAAIAAKTYMNYKKKKTTNPTDPRFWEYDK